MKAYLLALRQFIVDFRLWKLMFWCAMLSLALFAVTMAGVGWGLQQLAGLAGKIPWLATSLAAGGWVAAFVVTLFLFPALFGLIGGFFYESVADAVDARHYPELPAANGATLAASLRSGLQYFALMLALNCLALPLYLALLWVAGAGLGLYVLVNGALFGREHYDAVALRRMTPQETALWRRSHRGPLLMQGMLTALLGMVPVVNLIAPLVGIAAMTHTVNRRALP